MGRRTAAVGAGALAALGAIPLDADRAPLPDGGAALARCAALAAPPALPGEARLVVAADVDNPLLGRYGAAEVFGPQKGADRAAVAALDAALARYLRVLAAAVGREADELAGAPAAGAAGGLGAALLACGAERVSGAGLVRELTGLDAALDVADLVLTGEGSFDRQSLRGKLVTAVALAAAERGLPCLVLAGSAWGGGRRPRPACGRRTRWPSMPAAWRPRWPIRPARWPRWRPISPAGGAAHADLCPRLCQDGAVTNAGGNIRDTGGVLR